MYLVKQIYKGVSNWLERVNQEYEWDKPIRDLMAPTHNMKEVIPGWDDDYPDPTFTNDWRLTSEEDNLEVDTDFDSTMNSGFNEDETQYLNLIDGCTSCKYFHGTQYNDVDLICGIHPFGNTNCSDFETKYGTDSNDLSYEPDETVWLTEQDELIAQYGWHNYEFVKDAEWVSDDLENYLGRHGS